MKPAAMVLLDECSPTSLGEVLFCPGGLSVLDPSIRRQLVTLLAVGNSLGCSCH